MRHNIEKYCTALGVLASFCFVCYIEEYSRRVYTVAHMAPGTRRVPSLLGEDKCLLPDAEDVPLESLLLTLNAPSGISF